jgi:ribonuclease HI
MYFDGSLMKTGAGTGLIFVSPLRVRMCYVIQLHFTASNNIAEYKALVNGLHIAAELEIKRLDIRGDLQLIIDQVMKESSCHDPRWKLIAKWYDPWRTGLTASSSITSRISTMRPWTN